MFGMGPSREPGPAAPVAVVLAAALWLAGCGAAETSGGSSTLPESTTSTVVTTTTRGQAATTTTAPPATTTTLVPTTTSTLPATTTTTRPIWWRPISPEDPLRVWVIGDSLAGPVGSALRRLTEGSDVAVVAVDGRPGSGVASPFAFDWPAFVAGRLPEVAPEVVVCELGANDGQALYPAGGEIAFGAPEWEAGYGDLVGDVMDQLSAGAQRVYWVGVPIMLDPDYDSRIRVVNRVLRLEAGLRMQVRFVDIYPLLQWGSLFAMELPDANGNLVTVRDDDGIHFTYEGATMVAAHLLQAIRADWD